MRFEDGDVLKGFPGWTGTEYEPITVRVVSVRQIGRGTVAYDVRVTTVRPERPEPVEGNPRLMREEEWLRSPGRIRYVLLAHRQALAMNTPTPSE